MKKIVSCSPTASECELPSNSSLKATMLGCFILDNNAASLLEFPRLDWFYQNYMNTVSSHEKLTLNVHMREQCRFMTEPGHRVQESPEVKGQSLSCLNSSQSGGDDARSAAAARH